MCEGVHVDCMHGRDPALTLYKTAYLTLYMTVCGLVHDRLFLYVHGVMRISHPFMLFVFGDP